MYTFKLKERAIKLLNKYIYSDEYSVSQPAEKSLNIHCKGHIVLIVERGLWYRVWGIETYYDFSKLEYAIDFVMNNPTQVFDFKE